MPKLYRLWVLYDQPYWLILNKLTSFVFCSFALFTVFFLPWETLNMLIVKDKQASLWRYLLCLGLAGYAFYLFSTVRILHFVSAH